MTSVPDTLTLALWTALALNTALAAWNWRCVCHHRRMAQAHATMAWLLLDIVARSYRMAHQPIWTMWAQTMGPIEITVQPTIQDLD